MTRVPQEPPQNSLLLEYLPLKSRRCFPLLQKCNGFEPATTVPVLLLIYQANAQRATHPVPYYLLVEIVKTEMQILLLTARI